MSKKTSILFVISIIACFAPNFVFAEELDTYKCKCWYKEYVDTESPADWAVCLAKPAYDDNEEWEMNEGETIQIASPNVSLTFEKPEDCSGKMSDEFQKIVDSKIICKYSCDLEKCKLDTDDSSIYVCKPSSIWKWKSSVGTQEKPIEIIYGAKDSQIIEVEGAKNITFSCVGCSDTEIWFEPTTPVTDGKAKLILDTTKGGWAQKIGETFKIEIKAENADEPADFKLGGVYYKILPPECDKKAATEADCGASPLCKLVDGVCKYVGDITDAEKSAINAGMTKEFLENKYQTPDDYVERGGVLPPCAFSGTCRSVNNLLETLINFGKAIFAFIGSLAFVFFIYGGFTMIMSMGNAEKQKKGQQILVSAVVGIVIAFSAYMIINFMLDALDVDPTFRGIK